MRSHSAVRCQARRVATVLLLLVFAALSPRLANATPIAVQHPVINFAHTSDDAFDFFAFDDFTVGVAATARSVTWRGIYSGTGIPAVDAFTINLFADSAGPAGSPLASFTPGNAVHRTTAGIISIGGRDYELFDYAADLGLGLALVAGARYWLSIYNDTSTPGDTSTWNWAADDTTGSLLIAGTASGPFFAASSSAYFAVDAENLAVAAVPEPATLSLLGLGLGAIATRYRRCRR